MLIGYARVSTQDQNLDLQCEALAKAGCKKVFEDKVSGTRADRPGLSKTLEMLREGDTLVVWKLDRLGRSVKQLVDLHAVGPGFVFAMVFGHAPIIFPAITRLKIPFHPVFICPCYSSTLRCYCTLAPTCSMISTGESSAGWPMP